MTIMAFDDDALLQLITQISIAHHTPANLLYNLSQHSLRSVRAGSGKGRFYHRIVQREIFKSPKCWDVMNNFSLEWVPTSSHFFSKLLLEFVNISMRCNGIWGIDRGCNVKCHLVQPSPIYPALTTSLNTQSGGNPG